MCAVCAPLHSSSRRWCAGRGGEVAHTAHTAPGPLGASAPTRTAVVGAAVQLFGRFLAQIRPNRLTLDNRSSSSPRFSRFGPTMTAEPPLRRREPGRQVAGGGPSGAPPDRLHVPPRRNPGSAAGQLRREDTRCVAGVTFAIMPPTGRPFAARSVAQAVIGAGAEFLLQGASCCAARGGLAAHTRTPLDRHIDAAVPGGGRCGAVVQSFPRADSPVFAILKAVLALLGPILGFRPYRRPIRATGSI